MLNFLGKNGFTLVELIVVIVIVGILSTVGFVSYSGYITGARDSNRISQLVKLSDNLQVYSTKQSLPLPDDYVTLTASGSTNIIGYQGVAGEAVLETIDYTNGGKDPKDGTYFTYYVAKNRKNMQLLAFMEGNQNQTLLPPTYAPDYSKRFIKTYGKKLGILVQSNTNVPIQDLGITQLDLVSTTGSYIAYIGDNEKIEGTGSILRTTLPNASCKRVRQVGGEYDNSFLDLYIDGEIVSAFCHNDFIEKNFYTFVDNSGFEKPRPNAWYAPYLSNAAKYTGSNGLAIPGGVADHQFWDEYIYINPTKTYIVSAYARSQGSGLNRLNFGFAEYDENFKIIYPIHVNPILGTDSFLTQVAVPTGNTVQFQDVGGTTCAAWAASTFTTSVIVFNTDPTGQYLDLPNRKHTRIEQILDANGSNIGGYSITSVVDNGTTCTVTLRNPINYVYPNPNPAEGADNTPISENFPVGTSIRLHASGQTHNFIAANAADVPTTWTRYSGTITGQQQYGINVGQFRRGTRFVRLVINPDRQKIPTNILHFDDASLTLQ